MATDHRGRVPRRHGRDLDGQLVGPPGIDVDAGQQPLQPAGLRRPLEGRAQLATVFGQQHRVLGQQLLDHDVAVHGENLWIAARIDRGACGSVEKRSHSGMAVDK